MKIDLNLKVKNLSAFYRVLDDDFIKNLKGFSINQFNFEALVVARHGGFSRHVGAQ